MGQEIEVRPGIVSKDSEGKLMCKPIFSKIVSLFAEHNDLQYAAPGGLIGKIILSGKDFFMLIENTCYHSTVHFSVVNKEAMSDFK